MYPCSGLKPLFFINSINKKTRRILNAYTTNDCCVLEELATLTQIGTQCVYVIKYQAIPCINVYNFYVLIKSSTDDVSEYGGLRLAGFCNSGVLTTVVFIELTESWHGLDWKELGSYHRVWRVLFKRKNNSTFLMLLGWSNEKEK